MPQEQVFADLASHPAVIGIGEAGLDYFYDRSPRDIQARHLQNSDSGCPRSLRSYLHPHPRRRCRYIENSARRTRCGRRLRVSLALLQLRPRARRSGRRHGRQFPSQFLRHPDFSEISRLRAIAADLPADRLLVETDAPYLAPTPFRGKRNEPAHVVHTARVLGEARGLSPEAVAELTTENFYRLFKKAAWTACGCIS